MGVTKGVVERANSAGARSTCTCIVLLREVSAGVFGQRKGTLTIAVNGDTASAAQTEPQI